MDPAEQPKVFDQLANKAKRAGLLRYHKHGLLIVTLPEPSPALSKRVAPAPTPDPSAAPASPG